MKFKRVVIIFIFIGGYIRAGQQMPEKIPEIPKGDFLRLIRNTINRPSQDFYECLRNAYQQVKSDTDLRNFLTEQPRPFDLHHQTVAKICSLLRHATREISGVYNRQLALLELQQSLSSWPDYVRDHTAEHKKDDETDLV